jgi:chemotaxis signal transduction protein
MELQSDLADDERTPQAPLPRWLLVACSGNTVALPIDCVREIVPPVPFTRIPGAGPEICGLAGVRGRVVTTFDLGVLLGGRPAREHADFRILLIDGDGRMIGLVVEVVSQVTDFELQLLAGDAARPVAPPADAEAVLGHGTVDGGVVQALDIAHMLLRRLVPSIS